MLTKINEWCNDSLAYYRKNDASRVPSLHKAIAKSIDEASYGRILDFGGGDGRFIRALSDATAYDITVYDPDPLAIDIARENFESRSNVAYTVSDDELQDAAYEHIVFSNVLMILESEELVRSVLDTIRNKKTANGKVYVGITHPCFLDRQFTTFTNDYTEGKQTFDYLDDGAEYNVYMDRHIEIRDFCWSLSFVINMVLKCGFSILGMQEVPDVERNNFSPFLILTLS